jgi:hypothetical protein
MLLVCRKIQQGDKTVDASADVVVVQLSSIMASAVTVDGELYLLVTSASGPVPDVDVDVYMNTYSVSRGDDVDVDGCRSVFR